MDIANTHPEIFVYYFPEAPEVTIFARFFFDAVFDLRFDLVHDLLNLSVFCVDHLALHKFAVVLLG